jgi:tetratricopeptide (TPR) repeat protein
MVIGEFMRYFIAVMLLARALFSEISEDEALALRRIADFWEEGEYQIAKNQMESFLEQFPDSSYKNTLSSALGDLFLREKSYQTALNYYAQIQDPALSEKIFLHRMQCLYHLEWHATLADECEAYLQREERDPAHRLEATYLLAIALYSQALTPQKNSQALIALAERAKPYFEQLSHSELSEEVAGAFAHLQCILKDYEGASKIYLDLAEKSEMPEQYLFQAALIQSKYDQNLALQTFGRLAKLGDLTENTTVEREEGELSREAAYNMLVLYFEQKRYEEIIAGKEKLIDAVPLEKRGLCSLFLGQSYLHVKKFAEAAAELNNFLNADIPEERIRPALLFLVEAAYQSENIDLLDTAIGRLRETDPEMPKALFCRAIVLKKQGKIEAAKEQIKSLLSTFTSFVDRPHAWLELANLEAGSKQWAASREAAIAFLEEFNNHEFARASWTLLLAASSELGEKKQFIADLYQLLQKEQFLSPSERNDWVFRLGKAYFEEGDFEQTMEVLTPLLEHHGNAQLLFAFSLRDGRNDEPQFCTWAEKALASKATLLSLDQHHIALFNAYLKQNKLEAAAQHLYAALLENGELQPSNLLWLANYFYAAYEKDPSLANPTFEIFSRLPSFSLEEEEPFRLKLAKLHRDLGRVAEAQDLLETLDAAYRASPSTGWACEKETRVCLAQLYLVSGAREKAEKLFDEVASSNHYRDRFSALAALESVRLKCPFPDDTTRENGITRLKNLILQKKLEQEPIHLEAALDYIDLLSQNNPAKKLALLQKIKTDFESTEDLLSKDYHAAQTKFPQQSKIYRAYMRYLEAEILYREKSLHTKAKEILLQIKSEAEEPLLSRVESLLKNI